jgi:hypothetical protein
VIDGRRHWYQVRPHPRRHTDLMGIKAMSWKPVGIIVVVVLIVLPYPWW